MTWSEFFPKVSVKQPVNSKTWKNRSYVLFYLLAYVLTVAIKQKPRMTRSYNRDLRVFFCISRSKFFKSFKKFLQYSIKKKKLPTAFWCPIKKNSKLRMENSFKPHSIKLTQPIYLYLIFEISSLQTWLLNLIFTDCVACKNRVQTRGKNQVHQTRYFKN